VGRIRVLLVDESNDFVDGLSAWLTGQEGMGIVWMAHRRDEAIAAADRLAPDLIVLDARTPPSGGFDAARRLRERHPAAVIVITSIHVSAAARWAAVEAGADYFMEKSAVATDIDDIVRRIRGRHDKRENEERRQS